MKKIRLITLLLTAALILGSAAVPAYAAPKVGDPIGDVLYTDIVAYIDGYAIRSYNINWNTYIVVEDLLMYGFSVVWYGDAKKLVVYPERTTAPENYTADYTPGKSGGKNGEVAMPYLYTDITTWIGSDQVEAYNIGGYTCMCIDDLAKVFAETYVYDNASRTLKMTSPKFGVPSVTPPPSVPDDDEPELAETAEKCFDELMDDLSVFDSVAVAELGHLGDIYGDDIVNEYMRVVGELFEDIKYTVTDTKVVAGGVNIDVTITARNLEGLLTSVMVEAIDVFAEYQKNGITFTEKELSELLIIKVLDEIDDSSRPTKKFKVTVKADVDAKGNVTIDLDENAELINAMFGGLLDDPILGD